MPYLVVLALIVIVAAYLCARLFPRTHTNPPPASKPAGHDHDHDPTRPAPHEQRTREGDTA